MEDVREPSASSQCNGSRDTTHGKQKKKDNSVRRKTRGGFSDSFASDDMVAALQLEDENNENKEIVQPNDNKSISVESDNAAVTSASNKTSTSDSSECQEAGGDTDIWRGFFKMLKIAPVIRFQTFTPLKSVPKLTRKKSKRVRQEMVPPIVKPPPASVTCPLDGEFSYFKSTWKNFSQAELRAATNDYSNENLIGQGGYAEVYKGQFPDGQFAAIKRLTKGSPEEMTMDFLSELGIIVHVDHPNIAKLIGYSVEGGMHLDFEPQISDFGLAKWLPDQWTHHTVSKIEGTFGYLPPEFFMHGIVDEKTDVYAFGVLLLELITGRQALDSSQHSLVMWAKPKLEKDNNTKELVDPDLVDAYDKEQMKRIILTASMCVHQDSMNRPIMSQVVQTLRGDKASVELFKLRQKSKLQRTYSEELLDAEEYNSTKYLSEMNLQMEIVLREFNDI
ncbi:hypothetical protein ACFE04_006705 [Oxalis oulophora]